MQRHSRVLTAFALLAGAFFAPAASAGYVIDSNVADWGLVRTGQASNWTPSASVKQYAVDDQTGGNNVYLNPGYGGQKYDAEAIYLDWDATNLYVLVVTGVSPNQAQNPAANSYGAGDILIDFGLNGSFDYGVAVKNYAGLNPGTLYRADTFHYGIWTAPGVVGTPGVNPVAIKTGTALGATQLSYSATGFSNLGQYASDTHYAIETAIPLALLGSDWGVNGPNKAFFVQWTMYCANDIIGVDPAPSVPEPGVPALLAAVLGAATVSARKRTVR